MKSTNVIEIGLQKAPAKKISHNKFGKLKFYSYL